MAAAVPLTTDAPDAVVPEKDFQGWANMRESEGWVQHKGDSEVPDTELAEAQWGFMNNVLPFDGHPYGYGGSKKTNAQQLKDAVGKVAKDKLAEAADEKKVASLRKVIAAAAAKAKAKA